jgi:hypothetical protein
MFTVSVLMQLAVYEEVFVKVSKLVSKEIKNCIYEEIKSRLNFGNASSHLLHNLMSYSLLSKNLKITITKL